MLIIAFLGTLMQATIPESEMSFLESPYAMYNYPFLHYLMLAKKNSSHHKAIKTGMATMFLCGKNVRDKELNRPIMSLKEDFSEIDPEMGKIIECAFKIDEIIYLQKKRNNDYWSKLSQKQRDDHTEELCNCLKTLFSFKSD